MTAPSTPEPTRPVPPTREQVQAAPKVLLHDHLDGGLRPQTIIDLAAEIGGDHCPPATTPSGVGPSGHSTSLPRR